jgi:hypothetical protein
VLGVEDVDVSIGGYGGGREGLTVGVGAVFLARV